MIIEDGLSTETLNDRNPDGDLVFPIHETPEERERKAAAAEKKQQFERSKFIGRASIERWTAPGPAPAIPWAVRPLFPRGMVTLLPGEGGVGKSLLCQTAVISVASGEPFLGLEVTRGSALGWFGEDPEHVLHERHKRILRATKVDEAMLRKRAFILSTFGKPESVLFDSKGPTSALTELESSLGYIDDPSLLVIDNISIAFQGDENIRSQVTSFLTHMNAVAHKHNVAIVLVAHASKTKGDGAFLASGSTAWFNASRSVVGVEGGGKRRDQSVWVKHAKANHSAKHPAIELQWRDDVLVRTSDVTGTLQSTADHVFVACLAECERLGRPVSHLRRAGNFAPRLFQSFPAAKEAETGVDALTEAMERLFALRVIDLKPYDRPAKNLKRVVLSK
jgi:archaellum biogenesis ATPase FlaH